MQAPDDIRPGEVTIRAPDAVDAQLRFIGLIRTPWMDRADCPRQGDQAGPECRIQIHDDWVPALAGVQEYENLEVLYWLDQARRDLTLQNPTVDGRLFGTFAPRSPIRPNPIGTSLVRLISVQGSSLLVRGLDCIDGTPLLGIKPARCKFTPKVAT